MDRRRLATWGTVALASAALGAACNALSGLDDLSLTTSTASSGGSGGGTSTTTAVGGTSTGGTGPGGGGAAGGGAIAGQGGTSTGGSAPTGGAGGVPNNHVCLPLGAQDCSPGSGTGVGGQCADTPSCFLSTMQSTINGIIAAQPSWFVWDEVNSCWTILELQLFLDAVVTELGNHDLCALRDPNAPDEEITIKRNNDFAESFDIVAANGCARTGGGSYTGFCAPAWW